MIREPLILPVCIIKSNVSGGRVRDGTVNATSLIDATKVREIVE